MVLGRLAQLRPILWDFKNFANGIGKEWHYVGLQKVP